MTNSNTNNTNNFNSVSTFNEGWAENAAAFPATSDSAQRNYMEEQEQVEKQPYTNKEIFKESIKRAITDTTLGVLSRKSEIDAARRTVDTYGNAIDNPILTKEEANAEFGKYGVSFNRDIRRNEAELIAKRKIEEYYQNRRLQESEHSFASGASSLLGGFVGAMADPINIATAFIPVTKVIPALKALEAAGVGGRIALKGLDGMIMNSIVEPLPLWMASIDQRDYTMADSLFNIVAGGVFGAGIGGFTEGVRALTHGEKFNANLAAAIDFANNKGLDNIKEFQAKNPAVTSFMYDDLVTLPDNILQITEGNGKVAIRLAEDGPLSELVGYGRDLSAAKQSLREQLGYLLQDDSIFKGYRLDDGLDRFFKALSEHNDMSKAMRWLPTWMETLGRKADKAGLSLEDYLAKHTDNFTNFERLIKRAKQSAKMKIMFGELTGESLDDALENAAEVMKAYAVIKDAIKARPRDNNQFFSFFDDLQERTYNQDLQLRDFDYMTKQLEDLRARQLELKNQLDMTEDLTKRADLDKQISDLNASINDQETNLLNFKKVNDIDAWKLDAENAEHLRRMREKLEEDPRTFADVKEQLHKQVANEDGVTWDTKDSILDDMSTDETPVGDEAHIAKLNEEITIAKEDIKAAMRSTKFTPEEISALGLDKEGNSVDMLRADREIEKWEQFSEDAEHYAECRRTEAI